MALALLAVGTLLLNGCSAAKPAEKKSIRIGVTLYRGEDAFINNIRSSLEEKAKEYEQQTGIKVNLEIMDRRETKYAEQPGRSFPFPGIRCDLRQYGGSLSSIVCHQQGDGCRDAGRIFQPRTGRGGHETVGAPLLCRGRTRGNRRFCRESFWWMRIRKIRAVLI